MSRAFHLEYRIPIPFTGKALHVETSTGPFQFRATLGPRRYDFTIVEKCPDCRSQAYWHSNVGASILWCPNHGVLATRQMTRGSPETERQLSDEQYERFVEQEASQ